MKTKNPPARITVDLEPVAVAGLLALADKLQDPAVNQWVGSDAERSAALVALEEICWQLANAGDREAIKVLAAKMTELDDKRNGVKQGEVKSHVGTHEKDGRGPDDRR